MQRDEPFGLPSVQASHAAILLERVSASFPILSFIVFETRKIGGSLGFLSSRYTTYFFSAPFWAGLGWALLGEGERFAWLGLAVLAWQASRVEEICDITGGRGAVRLHR